MIESNEKGTMKVVLDEGAYMPTIANDLDAGYDLYAMENAVIPAGGSYIFDTGVHIELPFAFFCNGILTTRIKTVGMVKSRSGLNTKNDILTEGVIDMGYTGAIKCKLYNHGDKDYSVRRGDRIAQLVITFALTPDLEQVNELPETDRGSSGFGSTGR